MMKIFFRLLLIIGITSFAWLAAQAQAPVVEKVEPPGWWANHTINPVRVLVRGVNFKYVEQVKSTDKLLRVSNVKTRQSAKTLRQSDNYLFFDVTVSPDAKAGKYFFEAFREDGKALIPFEILAPLDARTNFQGMTNEDVIYLIMTDRFRRRRRRQQQSEKRARLG